MRKIDLRRFDANMKTGEVCAGGGVFWIDADDSRCRLDGFAFRSAENVPAPAVHSALPEAVNALAGHTAGGMLTFRTDSRRIRLRARLENHCGWTTWRRPAPAASIFMRGRPDTAAFPALPGSIRRRQNTKFCCWSGNRAAWRSSS